MSARIGNNSGKEGSLPAFEAMPDFDQHIFTAFTGEEPKVRSALVESDPSKLSPKLELKMSPTLRALVAQKVEGRRAGLIMGDRLKRENEARYRVAEVLYANNSLNGLTHEQTPSSDRDALLPDLSSSPITHVETQNGLAITYQVSKFRRNLLTAFKPSGYVDAAETEVPPNEAQLSTTAVVLNSTPALVSKDDDNPVSAGAFPSRGRTTLVATIGAFVGSYTTITAQKTLEGGDDFDLTDAEDENDAPAVAEKPKEPEKIVEGPYPLCVVLKILPIASGYDTRQIVIFEYQRGLDGNLWGYGRGLDKDGKAEPQEFLISDYENKIVVATKIVVNKSLSLAEITKILNGNKASGIRGLIQGWLERGKKSSTDTEVDIILDDSKETAGNLNPNLEV